MKSRDYLRTSVPGVYAAGDLRQNLRQVVTATADGLRLPPWNWSVTPKQMSEKTGLVPPRPCFPLMRSPRPRPPLRRLGR